MSFKFSTVLKRSIQVFCIHLLALMILSAADRQPSITWVNQTNKTLPPGVQHLTFESSLAKTKVGYCVYLPPNYEKDKKQRYPVIYCLHGNGGNEFTMLESANYLQKGIQAGRWPEMIIVFPNGGHSLHYKDSYDGRFPIESILMTELIPFIDQNYRTIAKREGRCIEGFSMGGRGATRLAMKYPKMFCSLFCQAGNVPHISELYDPEKKDEHPYRILGPDKQNYIDNDAYLLLIKNLKQIKGKMRIQIACGTKDYGHINTIRDFHQALLKAKVDHTYIELEDLAHKRTQMMKRMEKTWFDYHVESLKKNGSL